MGADLGGFIFFSVMREYIKHQLDTYLADGLNRIIGFVGVVALTMLTLWIMIQGYRIMTGQSREPLIGFIINAGKAVMIITIATSGALYNSWVADTIDDFRDEITYLITGSNQDVYRQVDKNLAITQTVLSTISSLAKDEMSASTAEAKKAWWIGAFGGAGPAIVGGMVSLLNEIMMHFAIMLGPLFILGLLFEQTKQLFWQWVKSVLGLMLSMGVLAFLSGLVMKISIGYATAAATAMAINRWLGSEELASFTDTMMVQGGIGLLLTTLLITIPPAVSQFVGGTLGAGVSGFTPWGSAGGGNPAKGQNTQQQAPSDRGADSGSETGGVQGTTLPRTGSNPPSGGADQAGGNAPSSTKSPEAQLADIDRRLATANVAGVGQGFGVTASGNVYQLGGNTAVRQTMADAGNSPPVSAEVKGLVAQRQDLMRQIAANKAQSAD